LREGIKHITLLLRPARITAMALLCLFISLQALNAQSSTASKEYRVKAVFLFNFTQFVEWPTTAFAGPTSPFVIGILGDDPFGTYIDETIANEKVNGHPLQIQRYRDIKEMKHCHILFINSNDPERVRENLLFVSHNTLTVSDAGNFIRMGGMIRFFTENNKIRLQINPDAAKAADLFISSKLLRVSEIFDPKGPK
jgi:preprotein translocase subunit Sec61beta